MPRIEGDPGSEGPRAEEVSRAAGVPEIGPLRDRGAPLRRAKAGGARKRPARYDGAARAPEGLAAALAAHRHGRLDEAIERYRALLDACPASLDGWMNLGSACAARGRATDARAAFAAARALAPAHPRALRDAGVGLAAIGAHDEARQALETALVHAPELVGPRLWASRLAAELGDPDAARGHAAEAVARAPDEASAHLELARASFDDRAPLESAVHARRAVAIDPGYAHARVALAGALGWAGRSDDVREALGPPGLVAPGLVDALGCVLARRATARVFSTKRDTLRFAASLAPPGAVVELGVRHGVSTRLLASLLGRTVHAFDAFEGLPEPWQRRPPGAFTTAGEAPPLPPEVTLHVGWFEHTLASFVASLDEPVALVHVDSDLYSSARTGLDALAPRLAPGAVIVLDEYVANASFRDDEHRALAEVAAREGWALDERSLSFWTGQGVVMIGGTG